MKIPSAIPGPINPIDCEFKKLRWVSSLSQSEALPGESYGCRVGLWWECAGCSGGKELYFLPIPRASWADWAALPRVCEAESRTPWPCLEASLLVPETASEAFWPMPFLPAVRLLVCDLIFLRRMEWVDVQGWTEPATLSAVFLMESPACSRPDFWLSGLRAEVALSVVDWRL